MARCTVIGSGPSGVHFALTALELGYSVEMIDVGNQPGETINPGDTFQELKHNLPDPAAYFLGEKLEGTFLPGLQDEFYGIPPSKSYALKPVPQLVLDTKNFKPMFSFAKGGLAQMWTGGCYPFNEDELESFPFPAAELASCYSAISRRIGINGMEDDLSRFIPLHDSLQSPLKMDEHSSQLYSSYNKKKKLIQEKYGCYIGHARQAVLSQDMGTRKSCQYTGRCLWGCPVDALYTPGITLAECMQHPNFVYHGDRYVTHFTYNDEGRISTVETRHKVDASEKSFTVDRLVLAGGALGTSRIFMESVYRKTGELISLRGLMDNRQILVPFVNLRMIGKKYNPDSYQYNQLAMELENGLKAETVHCLITTLKTAMIHPVIEKFPFDLRTSLFLFKNIHAALGVVNVNFHDSRREDNYLSLETGSDSAYPKLQIRYTPPAGEQDRISDTIRRIRGVLWKLGCVIPPGMVYTRPMGASVHYAGTIPMSGAKLPWTVDSDCRSHDFSNLYIADGATYPFLPAKNITFTLMANAMRVALNMGKHDGVVP